MIKNINEQEFKEVIQEGTFLVDFYADWCGPCKMLSPFLEQLSTELNDVTILKVDIDQNKNLAAEMGITSIPTLKVFKDGTETNKHVGFLNKDQIKNLLNEK